MEDLCSKIRTKVVTMNWTTEMIKLEKDRDSRRFKKEQVRIREEMKENGKIYRKQIQEKERIRKEQH